MALETPQFKFQDPQLAAIWDKVSSAKRLDFFDGVAMLNTTDLLSLGKMANWAAEKRHGKIVTYVLNRQCNPTNWCVLDCKFCEFARRKGEAGGWEMDMKEILEHCEGGVQEIHMVGGLHPDWKFEKYVEIVREIRKAYPKIGIKAWTAVEIDWFAKLERKPMSYILQVLKDNGLDALPGGGAEVFSERVRQALFKTKIGWDKWSEAHREAHKLGIASNATLLYGHMETYEERIDHILKLRQLQDEAPGFMSFIPLAFQPGNTGIPVGKQGAIEDARLIAASRLLLDNFAHIKAYWVLMSPEMASISLSFGASDLDGTIGKEKIMHMAGNTSPEGLAISSMRQLIREGGKQPQERDIVYNYIQEPAGINS
jgi:aminodeoxyfutalosine synthase